MARPTGSPKQTLFDRLVAAGEPPAKAATSAGFKNPAKFLQRRAARNAARSPEPEKSLAEKARAAVEGVLDFGADGHRLRAAGMVIDSLEPTQRDVPESTVIVFHGRRTPSVAAVAIQNLPADISSDEVVTAIRLLRETTASGRDEIVAQYAADHGVTPEEIRDALRSRVTVRENVAQRCLPHASSDAIFDRTGFDAAYHGQTPRQIADDVRRLYDQTIEHVGKTREDVLAEAYRIYLSREGS